VLCEAWETARVQKVMIVYKILKIRCQEHIQVVAQNYKIEFSIKLIFGSYRIFGFLYCLK